MKWWPRRRRPVVFLHIGAMKTGTTYLQSLLESNRAALGEAGFLLPGTPRELTLGVRDILRLTRNDPALEARASGVWSGQVAKMRDWRGPASIYSMEFLASADETEAARVIDSLQGLDVHVILTVRDALSAIPAEWQRWSRNRGTMGWPDYVEQLREGRSGSATRVFTKTQDVVRMVRTWAPLVPAGRFHVLVVQNPSAPRELLWERFAGIVGVDPAVADTSLVRPNPSLGFGASDLLRRINPVQHGTHHLAYKRVERHAAREVFWPHREHEPKHRLDAATAEFALDWNRTVREALQADGVRVVGDLADLPTEADPQRFDPGDRPVDVDPAVVGACARLMVEGYEARAAEAGRPLPPRDSDERAAALTRGRPVQVDGLPADVAADVRLAAATMRLMVEQEPTT